MGRKKIHPTHDLIPATIELFRAHGFAGTTTDMLVRHLGTNRSNLYAELGNKQTIFEAAARRYEQEVLGALFGPLEAEGAGLDAITGLLDGLAASAEGSSGLGCLFCNIAVELAGVAPGGERFAERYFERMTAAFEGALTNARRAGEVGPGVDPADEARMLAALTLGVFVLVRSRASLPRVEGALRAAKAHLAGLRPASAS